MIEKYVFPANMILMVVLGIRDIYLGSKVLGYLRDKYPEKAAKLGCNTGTIKFTMWLHKREEASDTDLVRLKSRARNARDTAILVVLVSAMFWILYVLVVILPRR